MKSLLKYLLAALALTASGCKLDVLDDPNSITIALAQDGKGPYLQAVNALKWGFEAHNQIAWVASIIGNEELASVSANISQTAPIIEERKLLPADLGQNATIANNAYTSLSLAGNSRTGVDKSVTNPAAKALYLGNLALIEGMVYGDWSKFYEATYERGTSEKLTPEQTLDLAVKKLQEAITQFTAYNDATDLGGTPSKGLITSSAQAVKFCNSYIGMLYFDTKNKAKAAEFLQKGYAKADAGKELAYKNVNNLTTNSDGIYSAVVSGAAFQLNQYSASFQTNRIPDDTLRRFAPNWFRPQTSATDNQNKLNYFYPSAPGGTGAIPAASRVAYYPVITWAEVALMLADPVLGKADAKTVIADVLASWKIPTARATALANDPAVTLERVSRYEYAGRARRWSAVGTYARWPIPNEFGFR